MKIKKEVIFSIGVLIGYIFGYYGAKYPELFTKITIVGLSIIAVGCLTGLTLFVMIMLLNKKLGKVKQ